MQVFKDETGGNPKLKTSEYSPQGILPIIDQGKADIAGYSNDATFLAKVELPVIVFGDHTRIVKYVDHPFILGADGTKVLRPINGDNPLYLFHYLRSLTIPNAGYSRHYKFLKEVSIPLPPLDEQRRIAAIMDKADTLRIKRRKALAHLDDLGQAIFHEMFHEEEVAHVLSDAVTALVGGRNVVGREDSSNMVRVLKISAVTSGTYLESESKPLPADYVPEESHIVRRGDVIISRANTTELVGASALVEQTDGVSALPDKLWRAVPAAGIEPRFLLATLQSRRVRAEISRRSTGSGGSMKNISKPKLLGTPIAIATSEKQQVFARRIESVERLRAKYIAQLSALDELFVSLQERAFR